MRESKLHTVKQYAYHIELQTRDAALSTSKTGRTRAYVRGRASTTVAAGGAADCVVEKQKSRKQEETWNVALTTSPLVRRARACTIMIAKRNKAKDKQFFPSPVEETKFPEHSQWNWPGPSKTHVLPEETRPQLPLLVRQ